MKILLSALSFPTQELQVTAFIEVLAKELVRQDVEVTVLAPQSLTRSLRHKIPLCPQRYEILVKTDTGVKKLLVLRPYSITLGQGRFIKLSHRIDRFVVERTIKRLSEKPDVIYSHFWWAADNVVDYAVDNRIPLFVATGEHIINIDRYIDESRIAFIKKHTSGVICVSTKNKEESIEHHLTDGNNTIVLPNAVDSTLFYPYGKKKMREDLGYPQDAFIVAFCGRFSHRKGCCRVCDAITHIGDDQIKSIFIGLAAGEKLTDPTCDGILHKGPLSHELIPKYLSAVDVFVLPTLAEGCSNSIVEAMSCGLPIISSDLPFNYDILNEHNSIMIDPMNVHQIANAILRIKNDYNLKENMSAASLATASELTISQRVGKIIDFIRQYTTANVIH